MFVLIVLLNGRLAIGLATPSKYFTICLNCWSRLIKWCSLRKYDMFELSHYTVCVSINVFQYSKVLQLPNRTRSWWESHWRRWWKSAFRGPKREKNRYGFIEIWKYDFNKAAVTSCKDVTFWSLFHMWSYSCTIYENKIMSHFWFGKLRL